MDAEVMTQTILLITLLLLDFTVCTPIQNCLALRAWRWEDVN